MLLIQGLGRARAGQRGDLLAAAARVAEASHTDDGCVSYGFYTDIEDPDALLSLEVWRDDSSLAAHMGHEHTIAFLRLAAGLLDGTPVMSQYTIDDPTAGLAAGSSTSNSHETTVWH